MRYGFKKQAEELSEQHRAELGIRVDDALPARSLAAHLEVSVLTAEEIPGLEPRHVERLAASDDSSWSAFTMEVESRRFIVHNDAHALPRQESNIMHELAHICCEHKPGKALWIGPFCLRHYDPEQEEEAKWLGGALQIPRTGLLWVARRIQAVDRIAAVFGASEEMARFRLNKLGIFNQIKRERAHRR